MYILHILINVLIIGLFLYSKLLPYRDKLSGQFKSAFDFFSSIFTPLLNSLKSLVKPFEVGQGLSVDMTQLALLIILLLLNWFF